MRSLPRVVLLALVAGAAACAPEIPVDGHFACARAMRCPEEAPICRSDGRCWSTPEPDAYPSCLATADCEDGAQCARNPTGGEGYCAPACGSPMDCPPALGGGGAGCLAGRCRPECGSSRDCPMGIDCVAGRYGGGVVAACLERLLATPPQSYTACTEDLGCPAPLSCLFGVCLRECTGMQPCLMGEACIPVPMAAGRMACATICGTGMCPTGSSCIMPMGGGMICIPDAWPAMP